MEALVVTPDHPPRLTHTRDRPAPVPAAGEVLVRVHCAGICATDLEIVRGYMRFAGVPGHEFVGTVVAGPPALAGQRVVADINCPCGTCASCRRGLGKHCPTRTVLGIAGRDGVFAELVAVPAANCHVVPAELSDEQAVFAEPLAAAAHVLDALPAADQANFRVLVLGTGRLGLLVARVLARQPLDLTVAGRNPRTRALCGVGRVTSPDKLPAEPTFDAVVDCTGTPDGLRLALGQCRPQGTLVLKSTYAGDAPVNLSALVVHEQRIIGSRCGDLPVALELLRQRAVGVDDLVTARFQLADGVAAFEAAADPAHVKVLLRPGAS